MDAMTDAIASSPLATLGGLLAVALLVATGVSRFVLAAPPARRSRRLTAIGAGVVALAVVVFSLLAIGLREGGTSVVFDEALAAALARTPAPALSTALAFITHLGDRAVLVAVVIAIGVVLLAGRRAGFALAWTLACSGNGLLNPALKQVFARARPVHDAAYATVGEYSFPSGHTSGSVVVYGMLAYGALRLTPPRWHLPIVLAAVVLTITVAFSRMILRVHWASDVVAGFASGACWLAICIMGLECLRVRSRRAR